MARMTVLNFTGQIGAASDDIPVAVRRGSETIGTAKSLYKLASTGSTGILESKIAFVTVKREEIIIQVK